MFYYDYTMILLIPAILLTIYAQSKVNSAYREYAAVGTRKGYTGAQTARSILDKNNLTNVRIELVPGKLTDHYDPRTKVLRLSGEVYQGTSIASNAIAAHECGHAIQHALGYQPLTIRNTIVPVVNFASNISWLFIFGGLFFSGLTFLLDIGIILFSFAVIFQLITLPVEFNASSRALLQLGNLGILNGEELNGGKKVLDAAALTYVAAAATAIMQLARLILIRNDRD